MPTQAETSRTTLTVCLVEYNPLAARQLSQVLDPDSTLRLLTPDAVFNSRKPPPVALFVLDRGTLPAPLSKFLRFVHFRFPDAKVIVLGEPCAPEELVRLLFLGIQGFLAYSDVEKQLADALHQVADGHLWFEAPVLEQYVSYSSHLTHARGRAGHTLTRREQRIIELVLRRLSNKEIAAILGVSDSTVKFHLSNLFAKLGVQDRHAMIEVVTARQAADTLPPKPK